MPGLTACEIRWARPMHLEVVYTWPDGREEIRYRRPSEGPTADEIRRQIDELNARPCGSPYFYRLVDGDTQQHTAEPK